MSYTIACVAVFTIAFAARAQTPVGSIVDAQILTNGISFTLSTGATGSVRSVDDAIIQVRITPLNAPQRETGALDPNATLSTSAVVFDIGPMFALITDQLTVLIDRDPFRVIVFDSNGQVIHSGRSPSVTIEKSGLIASSFLAPQAEAYFGLGQRGGPVNRRGRTIIMRNTDEFDYNEFTDPHYQSFPFYIALDNGAAHGVFLDVAAVSFFDLAESAPDTLSFGATVGELNYYLFAGPTMADVMNNYTRLTGRPMLPPRWSLGYHHCRYGWLTRGQVLGIAQEMRAREIPCDSMWLDIDYMQDFHHFTWDPIRFPDPFTMNQALLDDGFKTVYINEPCVVLDNPLYGPLDGAGFFMQNEFLKTEVNEIFLGPVSWFDFSKAQVRQWYNDQLQAFLDVGVTALWNDLNEPASNIMPFVIYDFDGEPRGEDEARNIYALLENKMTTEAQLRKRPNTRPWNLSRSGFSGLQRYAATWSGDTASTYDSLRVSVQMSASMGLSGLAQFGHDVGGFLGSPDAEQFIRWLEFSCFTTFLRNHSVNTAAPREPWLYGEPFTSMIRERIETRYRWLPALYTFAERASRTGEPALAPMIFHDTHDDALIAVDTQFMIGRNILVAPIVAQGATSRSVRLPTQSGWYELATGTRYAGGQDVAASGPLGTIPLFARDGTILITGEPMQYVGAAHDPTLTIRAFPGRDGVFTLYEDDGLSFDYAQGTFKRTRFSTHSNAAGRSLSIRHDSGTFVTPARGAVIEFIDAGVRPARVTLNGGILPESDAPGCGGGGGGACWSYDSTARKLTVRVPSIDGSVDVVVTNVIGGVEHQDSIPGIQTPKRVPRKSLGPGPR